MDKNRWFRFETQPPKDGAMNLLCFAHAGGSGQFFKNWASYLEEEINVFPVQLPFRENRHKEEPGSSIEEILRSFLEDHKEIFQKPYALFGHSLGSIFAMELAYILEEELYEKCSAIFVSSTEFPKGKKEIPLLKEEEVLDKLDLIGGVPPQLLKSDVFMSYFLPIICSDLNLFAKYSWKYGEKRLQCPLYLFGGRDDKSISVERMRTWKKCSTQYLGEKFYEGDHFYLHHHWKDLLQTIKEQLERVKGAAYV